MSEVSWRVARLKGAAIEMTDQGFRDRRLSETLIPGATSTGGSFSTASPGAFSSIWHQAARCHRVSWGNRMMGKLNRTFKYPEFTILTLGTGKTAHEIADLMKAFKSGRSR